MKIRLAYGDTGLTLFLPEDMIAVDEYGPLTVTEPISRDEFLHRYDSSGAPSLLRDGAPLVIVNDGYRNTPTRQILDWLDSHDPTLLDRARFLIATGAHGVPTAAHLDKIFGQHRSSIGDRISWHRSRDLESMQRIGTDRFGGEVMINRRFLDADSVLILGSVEPHYFAGFTGGRKSIFPGISDHATIERNHALADSLEAAPLKLVGNPVAEQLDELLALVDLGRVVSIQTVQDINGQVADAFVGPLDATFHEAVAVANRLYAREITEPYDLVLAEVKPPLDRNLYQAQKALENTQMAVRDGGAAVVVSQCPEGVGTLDFFELAAEWDTQTNRARDGNVHFGSHKLSRVNLMSRRIGVYLYSDLEPHIPRRVYYEPIDDLTDFVHEFGGCRGLRIAVVRDAAHTVLRRA